MFFCVNCLGRRLRRLREPRFSNHARLRQGAGQVFGVTRKGAVSAVNSAGCLDRGAEGPTIVIYPEGTWYTYVDRADINEIIDEHLVHGSGRGATQNMMYLLSKVRYFYCKNQL